MTRPLAIVALAVALLAGVLLLPQPALPPIRLGVLHSLSGAMQVSEAPLVDAVRLAVEEINQAGGLLGRRVEVVSADGRSDPGFAAREAARLIDEEGVSALFACWTSACRKAVAPVVEARGHLMFYPVQYEGMERSPNLIYLGAAPNQQIVPGARWAMEQFGRRVYLVGSDYIFPRTANRILRDLIQAGDGEVLGERYLPLGSTAVDEVIADLLRQRPDVILNTINGDSNAALFGSIAEAGLGGLPILSFSVAEPELAAWGGGRLGRHFGVWSYFQSLPRPENQRFVAAFQARFGMERTISDPMEAAYVGVHLWGQAVREAGTPDPARVNRTILRQSLAGPSSVASVDRATRHLWKRVRIGQVQPDGQFREVFASLAPLRPAPWPLYRSRESWAALTRGIEGGATP